jgi:hypothetical protein
MKIVKSLNPRQDKRREKLQAMRGPCGTMGVTRPVTMSEDERNVRILGNANGAAAMERTKSQLAVEYIYTMVLTCGLVCAPIGPCQILQRTGQLQDRLNQ